MTVQIAKCPEHGLHGERAECFVCAGPVEQVPMVPVADVARYVRELPHADAWQFANLIENRYLPPGVGRSA